MNQKTINEISAFYKTKDKTILGLNRASKIFNKVGVSCKHFKSIMDPKKKNNKTTTKNKNKIMESKHKMRRNNMPLMIKKLTQSEIFNQFSNCYLHDYTDEINVFYPTEHQVRLGIKRFSELSRKSGYSCKDLEKFKYPNKTTTTNTKEIMHQKLQTRAKNIPLRSKKLTQSARGNPCTNCHLNDETVVFAHAQCIDKGMGIKSPDFWGAFLCYRCHDELGDNIPLNAIYRTQRYWHQNGFIEVK